jgi:(2S)-methylsuccinyl-CoA dehydrogenase
MLNLKQALEAAQDFRAAATTALAQRLAAQHIDAEQRAGHGFAWIATSVAALEAVLDWTNAGNDVNPLDNLVARLAFAE